MSSVKPPKGPTVIPFRDTAPGGAPGRSTGTSAARSGFKELVETGRLDRVLTGRSSQRPPSLFDRLSPDGKRSVRDVIAENPDPALQGVRLLFSRG